MVYKITIQEDWEEKHIFLLGIGIAGLVLSHVIMTIIIAFFVIIFLLFYFKRLLFQPVRIRALFYGVIFAVGLTAYWSLPFIEQYIVIRPNTNSNENTYVNNGIKLGCWFIPFDIYKIIQIYLGHSINIKWMPSCFGWIFIMLFFLIWKYYDNIKKKKILLFGIFSFVMMVLITLKPWNQLVADKLLAYKLQFPWRILMVVYFLFVVSIAYIVVCINKEILLKKVLMIVVISSVIPAMLIIGYGVSSVLLGDNKLSDYQTYNPNEADTLYLPLGADWKEIYKQEGKVISDQDVEFDTNRSTGYIKISVIENKDFKTILNVPFLYYKGYYAKNIDTGRIYSIEKNKQGYLNVMIGHDIGNIVVYYRGTKLQKISSYISLVSFIGFFLYFIKKKRILIKIKKGIKNGIMYNYHSLL